MSGDELGERTYGLYPPAERGSAARGCPTASVELAPSIGEGPGPTRSIEPDTALAAGTVIAGGYVIDDKLGEGGMGQVYRATQTSLDRQIALKLIRDTRAPRGADRQRVVREARVAAALDHPSAVAVYDVGRADGLIYIAMELIEGTRLDELPAPIPLADTLELIAQLADLLMAAHGMSLVHRDLKPSNIFVERDRQGRMRVRVVDFGLAFIAGDTENGRLTQEGMLMGTPAYLAPEQAQAIQVGPAADIYALGCVVYELLTGHRVFRGSHMYVVTQHVHVEPTPPSRRAPGAEIPAPLDALVLRMLSKQPWMRPSATELVESIAELRGRALSPRASDEPRPLVGRSARMVSVPELSAAVVDRDTVWRAHVGRAQSLVVGLVGELDPHVHHGLVVNGLVVEPVGDDQSRMASCEVLLTTRLDPAGLLALVGSDRPVVAIAGAPQATSLAQLLRLGISGVVAPPIAVDGLARTLRQAVARARRRRRRRALSA